MVVVRAGGERKGGIFVVEFVKTDLADKVFVLFLLFLLTNHFNLLLLLLHYFVD